MKSGCKVVCVNDKFSSLILELYDNLPKKGNHYTVRDVFLGRDIKGQEGEVGITLEELKNPPDPAHMDGQELGFRSERFRQLQPDKVEENSEEFELIGFK